MKHRSFLKFLIPTVILALIGSYFSWGERGSSPTPQNSAGEEPTHTEQSVELPVGATKSATTIEESSIPDLRTQFEQADDLWAFAESTIGAARSGNTDAQYYLSRALDYCESLYPFYFSRRGKPLTLDEGLTRATTRTGLSADEARLVHQRCSRLVAADSKPFGTSAQWLEEAKDAGHPIAKIDFAQNLANKAGVSGSVESAAFRNEAMKLALESLASKDPAVVFKFADLSMLFLGDVKKASESQWVWRLAGCERGYDCSANAEWLKVHCRFDYNCQPQDDGVEYIRRNNSQNFDELQSKAKALNERLDANNFENLFE